MDCYLDSCVFFDGVMGHQYSLFVVYGHISCLFLHLMKNQWEGNLHSQFYFQFRITTEVLTSFSMCGAAPWPVRNLHFCTARMPTGGSACSSLSVRLDHLFFTCLSFLFAMMFLFLLLYFHLYKPQTNIVNVCAQHNLVKHRVAFFNQRKRST